MAQQDLNVLARSTRFDTSSAQTVFPAADGGGRALQGKPRRARTSSWSRFELPVAAQLGTLDATIVCRRADPPDRRASRCCRRERGRSFRAGDRQLARKILDSSSPRKSTHTSWRPATFGVAEIRPASDDTPALTCCAASSWWSKSIRKSRRAASLLEKTGHDTEAIEFLDQLVKSAPWDPVYRLRLAKARIAATQDASSAQDSLTAIASDKSVAYGIRLQAALAVAGRSHADLGSGELNLLANPSSLTPAAADKFYFSTKHASRRLRARTTRQQIQSLSHCVIDFPQRPDVRYPLFEAEVSTRAYEQAISTLEPVFHTGIPAA